MTESQYLLTREQVKSFHDDGFLVIKGFYDVEKEIHPIQMGIYKIIGQVLKRHGLADTRDAFLPERFDNTYTDLLNISRGYGSEVYDAVKQIPAFIRLLSIPAHESVFKQLRGIDAIPGIAAGGYGIRVDNPKEDRYSAPWHQEYPAQLRSLDGLVYWSPLVELSPELGPVRLCVGSQRNGAVPVYTRDPINPEKSGAYGLILQDEQKLITRYEQVAPLTSPGDLVIIDFLTLHASGINRGDRSRWTMQFRYFNFNDPVGMRHGWKGSYAAGVDFAKVHPELCLDR